MVVSIYSVLILLIVSSNRLSDITASKASVTVLR